MAEGESILTDKIPDRIDQLSFVDKITHLGKQFTPEEKKKWWKAQPGKRHKIGLIRNKELDTAIQIFTESFDLSKKLKNHDKLTHSFQAKECSDIAIHKRPLLQGQGSFEANVGKIFSSGVASGIAAESLVKTGISAEPKEQKQGQPLPLEPQGQGQEQTLPLEPQGQEQEQEQTLPLEPQGQEQEQALPLEPQGQEQEQTLPQPNAQVLPLPPAPAGEQNLLSPATDLQEEEDSGYQANTEVLSPVQQEQEQTTVSPPSEEEEEEQNQTNESEANVESVNTSNRSNANSLTGGFRNGFNRSANLTTPEVLEKSLETIGSATDFERLYLGWLNNPALAKESDIDLQIRKNSLKSLFRFVFGKKNISDVTATTFQKKLRIAYTPLTTEEKVPCKGNIWNDFHESLKYRRKQAMCELYAGRDVVGEETLYVTQKKKLILGLRDLIDVMERTVYPCMEYGYDVTQHEPEEPILLTEEEYSRLLAIFRTFVKDRKDGKDGYSYNALRKKLSKKQKDSDNSGQSEKSQELYDQLLNLLIWMKGEAEAQERMNELKAKISELDTLSKSQKQDIGELEVLVMIFVYILELTQKLHILELTLEEMRCKVEGCCKKKEEAKIPRLLTPIENLEESIKKYKEEYDIITSKLRKDKNKQGEDIQELQDLILTLTTILLSIDRFHEVDNSITKVEGALAKCFEKKAQVQEIIKKLQGFEGNKAITTVSDRALELANETTEQLEKQIAELTTKYPNAKKPVNLEVQTQTQREKPNRKNTEIEEFTSRIARLQTDNKEANAKAKANANANAKAETFIQRGGSNDFCKTMLALLMVEASKNKDFDYKEFVKKANTTLEELGQCPLVTKALGYLMDESMNQTIPEEGYIYSPISETNNQEFARSLEKAYNSNFNDQERKIFNSMAPSFILHADSPEEFQDVLGRNSYFLNGTVKGEEAEAEDIPLYGLGQEDIVITPEERKLIEKGGVPAGGILVLYLISESNRNNHLNTDEEKESKEEKS